MTDEEIARAEAEGIARRWVPDHMTARQGLIDDITASLLNARRLERDKQNRDWNDFIAGCLT